jgi:hypothetical protein
MKIFQKIKDINNKAIFSGIGFLTMGLTATAIGSPLVGVIGLSSLPLSLIYIFSESINKYRISNNTTNPVRTSLLPQVYKLAFTSDLEDYINDSKTDLQKKYKIILTSFAFKRMGIDPKTIINNAYDKSYRWSEKYDIFTPDGKMVELFGGTNFHINYKELTSEDFKDPAKLAVAQEIYKDFSHLGMLGKEVSRIFGFNPNTEFLLNVHTHQLNPYDLAHIEKATQKIINTPTDDRAMNQPAKGREEEFIFDIIESNSLQIETLHKFHTVMHCHNGLCSYPKLITFINERLQAFQIKENLESMLPEKLEIKNKPKKI